MQRVQFCRISKPCRKRHVFRYSKSIDSIGRNKVFVKIPSKELRTVSRECLQLRKCTMRKCTTTIDHAVFTVNRDCDLIAALRIFACIAFRWCKCRFSVQNLILCIGAIRTNRCPLLFRQFRQPHLNQFACLNRDIVIVLQTVDRRRTEIILLNAKIHTALCCRFHPNLICLIWRKHNDLLSVCIDKRRDCAPINDLWLVADD